jgi:diacylglycerol kinase (ATP)
MVVSSKTSFSVTNVFALPLQKHGPRMKCSACKIIAHTSCINVLMERTKFYCKATFRDAGVRQYREQTCIHHHWVHRRSQKGKCKQCGKVWGVQEPTFECVLCLYLVLQHRYQIEQGMRATVIWDLTLCRYLVMFWRSLLLWFSGYKDKLHENEQQVKGGGGLRLN